MPKSKFSKYLAFSVIASSIFTLIDLLIHLFTPYFKIVSYKYSFLSFLDAPPIVPYAIGKFIGTAIMLIVLFYLFSKMKSYWKYSIMTLIVVAILEFRYMLDPYYSMLWHLFNLLMHIITLMVGIAVAELILYNSKKVL